MMQLNSYGEYIFASECFVENNVLNRLFEQKMKHKI